MKVLVACEESQVVCIAFRERGHEAYSCDILPCSGNRPEWHIQDDVLKHLDDGWDMMLAFPPCTYLTVTGARWLYNKDGSKNIDRWQKQEEAISFVKKLYYCNVNKICIENPIGKLSTLWMRPTQIIQPYYFGDTESKRTCLWLKNLPLLIHTDEDNLYENKTHVEPRVYAIFKSGKKKGQPIYGTQYCKFSEDRGQIRSKTFPGIAAAFAEQWG